MSKDYGSWSITDLKSELRKLNAKVMGKKAVLVKRLEDYDKLFGPLVTDPDSVFKIIVPAPHHFRDITSNSLLPILNAEDMEAFSNVTERDNISTSRNMYEEYFLMTCRVAVTNREYYITGMVASEMRKNVGYNVTVRVKNHLILEAQCECAAGMGPFAQCKHVLVIIFGIIEMNEHKTIKLKTSVTSHLQTFHQPKKLHTGDPVKAEELTLKFKDKKYKEMAMFDPRPITESAEKYSNNFKNCIVNFTGQKKNKITMPIAQLIMPADKFSVGRDHDYLKKTTEDEFLESIRLSDEDRHDLEKNTRIDLKMWKMERLMRLQSSNFGKICKGSSGERKLAISLVKDLDVSSAAIRHGLKYEEEAVRMFEENIGKTTTKCGIVVHRELKYLASTPDRLIEDSCVLEVKCPFTARNQKISPENMPYLYLCEQTGLLKTNENHAYYYQVQGQLMCTEREMAYFCVYTITDLKILIMRRNNCYIEVMKTKLKQFYDEHFKDIMLQKFLYSKKV